jgi:hypothetical protein
MICIVCLKVGMLPLLSGGWTYGRAEAAACARRITLLDPPIMEKPFGEESTPRQQQKTTT